MIWGWKTLLSALLSTFYLIPRMSTVHEFVYAIECPVRSHLPNRWSDKAMISHYVSVNPPTEANSPYRWA